MDSGDIACGGNIWSHGLDRRYSIEEVRVAREWAKGLDTMIRSTVVWESGGSISSLQDCTKNWDMLNTLLSDDTWGSGRAHLVDKGLKTDVYEFVTTMCIYIEDFWNGEHPARFMHSQKHRVGQKGFIRMLRLCLYYAPEKFEFSLNPAYGIAQDDPSYYSLLHTARIISGEDSYYTALQIAISSDIFPVCVLETLLQAGVRVDRATSHGDFGDTPLLLVMRKASVAVLEKINILLDYGADIDLFNPDFENVLHIAVKYGNVSILRLLLDVRQERLNPVPISSCPIQRYSTRLRKTGAGRCYHMINQHDDSRETPLSNASALTRVGRFFNSSECDTETSARSIRKARLAMIDLLVQHGADANEAVLPHRPYGWIQFDEHEDSVNINIRNGFYSVFTSVELDTIVGFVDFEQSVLPKNTQTVAARTTFVQRVFESLTYRSTDSRCFEFTGDGIDGCDFDIHFSVEGNMTHISHTEDDPGPRITLFGYGDATADYKIAVRFPRAPLPYPDSYYTSFDTPWLCTMAHRAVLGSLSFAYIDATAIEYPEVRSLMFDTARVLCNPLLKCSKGFTAVALLRKQLDKMSSPPLDHTQLLEKMQQDHDEMLTYIQSNVHLPFKTNHKRRRVTGTSRFDTLPDDVCKIILDYI